eukprot:TRINITY_DN63350_c0_g1_i1.p1 TRINITY_DN63350_c0_g1~~TRINITY_DN63350_c0_g1_i1.p1  ORF type:complete len:393 (+),score=48.75 TRINITY_DN63350_c0_g1_i1:178-1356(+)
MELSHPYVDAMLGQRNPPVVAQTDDIRNELLRADSLWASGNGAEAERVLSDLEARADWDANLYGSYATGLKCIVKGDLSAAYDAYCDAARKGPDVFAGERAANLAFWMACAGKMLQAGRILEGVVESKPFAGGILAFAQHMEGDSELAESIAKKAIAKGFDDPWTLHAVAHALYSMGKSQECQIWLAQHRDKTANCSVFMKTHMEFHMALCLIDMEEPIRVAELINGPMWGGLPQQDKDDYWAATGVLNALWKAELRGLDVGNAAQLAAGALEHLTAADVSKSKVFSLCILRWRLSPEWLSKINDVNHATFSAVASAVDMVYNQKDNASAAAALAPVVERLHELGASPEQREVIEEFVAVVLSKAGLSLEAWMKRNRRPVVAWYDKLSAIGQ